MKEETKKQLKENASIGGATAMGVVGGAVVVEALTPAEAAAQEMGEPAKQSQTAEPIRPSHATQAQVETQHQDTVKPLDEVKVEEVKTEEEYKPEIEVVGYERVTNEDGSQMDLAVLSDGKEEVILVDVDLDGKADAIISDLNHDGQIQENEVQFLQGQDVSMLPYQEAAGFNALYAQNDLPDYVNDADTDVYNV